MSLTHSQMPMIAIHDFIASFPIREYTDKPPWQLVQQLPELLSGLMGQLTDDYVVENGIAIHRSATVEQGVVLKPPVLIHANSFIGAHAYLRGGVYIAESVVIGPGCEIKSSLICAHSCIAHFNFIGDSIIGSHVNVEAGAITANYHNDKPDKRIMVVQHNQRVDTGVEKFGSLVGDYTKIGANAVLSPGTLLAKKSIVGRLELINQQVQ